MKTYNVITIIAGVLLFYTGCSKSVQKESGIASIESLYTSGVEKLTKNDQKGAEGDFRTIISRDRKSPMGYIGIALVELNRSEFKQGLLAVNRAIQCNPNFADAYVVQGRILSAQKKGSWFQDALESFDRAIVLDPGSDKALFYCGESYLTHFAFKLAEHNFDRALQLQGAYKDSASVKLAFVRKIIEVNPVSMEGRRLVVDSTIDRSELCTLLVEELKIKELLELYNMNLFQQLFTMNFKLKKENIFIPADVSSHPRIQWIADIVPLNIPDLSVLPNHKFYPDRTVTRDQLAVVVHGIQQLLSGDTEKTMQHTPEGPVFSDVRSDYYAYDAIKFCAGNGIMQPDSSGAFHPYDTVSGIETFRTIRNLQTKFK